MRLRISLRRLCLIALPLAGVWIFVLFHYHAYHSPDWRQPQPQPQQENVNFERLINAPTDGASNNNRPQPMSTSSVFAEKQVDSKVPPTAPTVAAKRPWFFANGSLKPQARPAGAQVKLFPEQSTPGDDRIQEQLMYIPPGYNGSQTPAKTIMLYNKLGSWNQAAGSAAFEMCPVKRCILTDDLGRMRTANAILFKDNVVTTFVKRSPNQIWILYHLECPHHTPSVHHPDVINWTATYRRDSDLVAPYEHWVYYDPKIRQRVQNRDYAANKTKMVAWFVSNCGARNGRLDYANELKKYIQVDIYGSCGEHKCQRFENAKCFQLLSTDYRFYLAFENSNCRDYITEKFFVNGLGHDVLPIVMGGQPEDYRLAAPENSYIHVNDFAGPKELAQYLHKLASTPALYNAYFRWKGTGELINTYFWCRLCALLHFSGGSERKVETGTGVNAATGWRKHYDDVNEWWRGSGVCSNQTWKDHFQTLH